MHSSSLDGAVVQTAVAADNDSNRIPFDNDRSKGMSAVSMPPPSLWRSAQLVILNFGGTEFCLLTF